MAHPILQKSTGLWTAVTNVAILPLAISRTARTFIPEKCHTHGCCTLFSANLSPIPLAFGKLAGMSAQMSSDEILRELHRSLDERWRPEDIALRVLALLDLETSERRTLKKAAQASRRNIWSSMCAEFQRPKDMSRQLAVAEQLFGKKVEFAADDVAKIEEWIRQAEESVGKKPGRNDFKYDRLPKEERQKLGIDISRRQYNKRFRLAVRLEKKAWTLAREQFKRSLTLASKNRLASRIGWEDFASDRTTACFIAYYVARCNLRSVFTNTSQTRPYDEICEMLMQRCNRQQEQTNWWAIAHVLPRREVVRHLDDEQKGVLLAEYFGLMHEAAQFLKELWETNDLGEDMVVRRGNDSTTWNVTAGAWNKLREGWFSLMYDLGMVDAVEQICPGKVLRLMAADVAFWHRQSGGDLHEDTTVWKELPRPWEVLSGEADCPKSLVENVCERHGLNPVKSGWSAPRPGRYIERFTPTPELVHGVVVGSPLLAAVFRKAGVFSGKSVKRTVPLSTVDEIRSRHRLQQEKRRQEAEEKKDKPSAV